MKVDLTPITVSLDTASRRANNQIENWLRGLSPEMQKKFCITIIGPWIENKRLYVHLIPRLVQGAEA